MSSHRRRRHAYAAAALAAITALALSAVTIRPLGGAYLYLPLFAVFVSALHGGLGPGLLTVVLSTVGFDFFFLGPPFHLGVGSADEAHRLAAFVLFGAGASWIAARFRRARRDAESARRRAERATAEARRIGELQERLVAIVGHDLRSPLAAVHGNLEILPRVGPLSERQARAVTSMRRSVGRMEGLIRDLLDVARTRQGGLIAISPREVRVGEVCSRAVAEIRDGQPQADVVITVDGDDRAKVDPDRVAQVVSNLVGNALQYGARETPVGVRVRADGDEVVLEVENEGEPIPPELLPHVFEPFRRGRADARGLGLGLFVVHEIARAHRGRAALRSADRRTVFEIRLPRAGADGPAAWA